VTRQTNDYGRAKQKQQKEAQTQRYPHFTTGKKQPTPQLPRTTNQTKPNVIQLCFV
jgi:hypothetical protein